MAMKKFFISDGEGEIQESELDSFGNQTIVYDDINKIVQLSSAYIVNNLYVSGSIIGNLTGSVDGIAGGGSGNQSNSTPSTINFKKTASPVSVGDIVSIGASGLAKCNNSIDLLSNVIGVIYSSGSNEVEVQVFGEAEVNISGNYSTGSMLFAGLAGNAVTYENIPDGNHITQVGFISGNGPGRLIIQPRIFGKK